MQKKLLEIGEVAEILKVNKSRAYQLAREDIIPVVRIGRQVRVDPELLDDWFNKGGKELVINCKVKNN